MSGACEGQYTLFDPILGDADLAPGAWVTEHGPELTFDEIASRAGQIIIMDKSTESHAWYKAVLVERIAETLEGRRLIYYDGHKQRGLVSEFWFHAERRPARAYEI